MNARRATYIDSSALVKLAVRELESAALRRYIRRRRPLVSSALARTEVARALLSLGPQAIQRGHDVLDRVDLIRINDRILNAAMAMLPIDVRSSALSISRPHNYSVTSSLESSRTTTDGRRS